jgi:sarcosine oxidase subunit delta
MHCPLNGPRNIQEFVWMGEIKDIPDQANCSDLEWTNYLFMEDNLAGEVEEWWLHAPSNYLFVARRNTLTDEVLWTKSVADYFGREQ